ncbi:hypothetical protein ACJMK2_034405 [Sinanodonta woodiana]|uniref:G-protein coupled receptors family 1 profile domain-containing protein n=1 Tax=Sinanodonta woodiana TaxID=1069815 RepID=A0ABD3WV92_SINWO
MSFWNNVSVNPESVSDSKGNSTDMYLPSSEIITILIILYVITTTLAIAGNSLAILIFAKGKRSKTDLRPFLINLAIADLIMAIFCIPFTFTYEVLNDWIFSAPMCPIVIFLQTVSVTGSVSTNMAIGLDRLVVVMYPFRLKLTGTKYRIIVFIIWIIAIAISAVQLVVARTKFNPVSKRTECEEQWPSNDWNQRYTIFLTIVFYVIPLIILTVTYSIIGCILWRRTVPGNADAVRDQAQLRSKRKIVKMLATVVALFALCWLPLHTFFLVYHFNPGLKSDHLNTAYFFVHWIAMSNCFVNPIIYGSLNDNFRDQSTPEGCSKEKVHRGPQERWPFSRA